MFQSKGHDFQMRSQGNKANGALWDGVMGFTTCFFPGAMLHVQLLRLVVRDLPLEKSTGRAIALTQKWSALLCSHSCLKTGAFLAWCLWPLLQVLWLLVIRPESLVILLFENEIKKNPQIWGNPQGKICFGCREACGNSAGRFWQ